MIKGVYSDVAIKSDSAEESVQINFYKNAEEMLLLNYIDYVQEGTNDLISALSDSSRKAIDFMIREYCSNVAMEGILALVIHFVDNVSSELLKEVTSLADGFLGTPSQKLSPNYFESIYLDNDKNYYSIKRVTRCTNSGCEGKSYCSIAVPGAFLLRSKRDSKGNLKNWPSDSDVDKILKELSTRSYYTTVRLDAAIKAIAGEYYVDKDSLCIMVQCLLANKVIDLKKSGYNVTSDFYRTVDELFKMLI